ncbi:RNA polymerase factor sigma-54 [Paenibacillus humicola]|uniref:RNA polymerase factor sigma-54 n=1 Tax=Paenibacillus humicola TaxID=3110540 RepID=UPI00237AB3FA|nr:RNA polymerase factor sigma-54 [Paenibacillus humicola]
MQLGYRLVQEQRPGIHMTLEMQQAIRLLQFSVQELTSFLHERSEENPFLEIEWPDKPYRGESRMNRADVKESDFNRIASPGETLEDKLTRQLRMEKCPAGVLHAACYLAGNVDHSGYLTVSLEEAGSHLGYPAEMMEAGLHRLQSLDPPGVGARTLAECLLLQIRCDERRLPFAVEIVSRFLPDLAKGKYDKIARETGTDQAHVLRVLEYIRSLNPRPCLAESDHEEPRIIVDAQIVVSHGSHQIELNHGAAPKLSVLEGYAEQIESSSEGEVKHYVRNCVKTAKWLIRGLEYRNKTLRNVIGAVVDEQLPFFEKGAAYMRPLNLETIAQKLDVHPSTVSRTARNKYVETACGVFPLTHFFSVGIPTAGGDPMSSKAVKQKIVTMIKDEDRRKPLSDQQISESLRKDGICLSRRTVAKYREEERILCSALRKMRHV